MTNNNNNKKQQQHRQQQPQPQQQQQQQQLSWVVTQLNLILFYLENGLSASFEELFCENVFFSLIQIFVPLKGVSVNFKSNKTKIEMATLVSSKSECTH